MKIGIAGYGFVGRAHCTVLQDHYTVLVSDPHQQQLADLQQADAIIICVSTPSNNGSCYMGNVVNVIENAPLVPILIKSTISLEGWDELMIQYPDRDICFSPEFLRAASAVQDLETSLYMLLGGKNTRFWTKHLPRYRHIIVPVRELILAKYFRNSFLALKVAFFNQIYDLCEATGIDYKTVARNVGLDDRIGFSHTNVTNKRGFGGHCFPKDTNAIVHSAQQHNVDLSILKQAIHYNNKLTKDTK